MSIPSFSRHPTAFKRAASLSLQRFFGLACIRHSGSCEHRVIYRLPHENGALTFAVLRHISMPRFIFSGKAPLPRDTEITARYTVLGSIGNQNTSISIGHLGELYVDFGPIGGVLAMMIIGLLAGRVYSALRAARRPLSLLNFGLCLMVLPLAYFGTAYAKLIGAFVFSTAIAIAFQHVVIPMLPANLKRLMRPPRPYSAARNAYQATHN